MPLERGMTREMTRPLAVAEVREEIILKVWVVSQYNRLGYSKRWALKLRSGLTATPIRPLVMIDGRIRVD